MGRVPLADPVCIYDCGCSTGNVTRMLADRCPAADIVGIDHSPQMLDMARATPSRVRWQHGDLADWRPEETPSLLFSNAVIHWLPRYRSLITRLWSLLPSGGCLALQAPMEPGPSLAPPSWARPLPAAPARTAVLEWVTSTSRRPILAGLGDADRSTFLDR